MDPVLLILAGITAFIIFRLISVMGTRTGHEQQTDFESLRRPKKVDDDQRAEDRDEKPVVRKPVSANAQPLRDADPEFDESYFLTGARAAYEMIVEAFAEGDLKSIRPYLNESVYSAFKGAVSARNEQQQSVDLKFVGIEHASIADSNATETEFTATVSFTSNQVRVTRDSEGNVIDGDPNRIDLVRDEWVFSKDRKTSDPNWVLVATGGAA